LSLTALKLKINIDVRGLWCLTPLSTIFHLYHGGQFGGNRSTLKKPPTYRKSLTNWISDSYLRKNRSKILQKHMAIYYVMGYFLVNPEKCDYRLLLKKSMLL
jgi:hypothetical protein